MVETRGIQDGLDERQKKLDVTNPKELKDIMNVVALDIAKVLSNDKNLFIDNSTLPKIQSIRDRLNTIWGNITEQITQINETIQQLGWNNNKNGTAIKDLNKERQRLLSAQNNLETRQTEYTTLLTHWNYFNRESIIPTINIDKTATPMIVKNNNQNLNDIFLNNEWNNTPPPEKIKLCDKDWKSLRHDDDDNYYTMKLKQTDWTKKITKIYGININENTTNNNFTLNIENLRFEPDDKLDLSSPLELSISAIYTNVVSDINITHNKKLKLNINDWLTQWLSNNEIETIFDNQNINLGVFYEEHYRWIEEDVIIEKLKLKDHPNQRQIMNDFYNENWLLYNNAIITDTNRNDLNNFISSYIIKNLKISERNTPEKVTDYISENQEKLITEFYKNSISTMLTQKNDNNILSLQQRLTQRKNEIINQETSGNQLLETPDTPTNNEAYTANVLVWNVEQVFLDKEIAKQKKTINFRSKQLLESKAGYKRRLQRRARIKARRELRKWSYRQEHDQIAKTAIERSHYEDALLHDLWVSDNRQLQIEQLATQWIWEQINNIAQTYISSNWTTPTNIETEFTTLIEDNDIIPKRQRKRFLSSSRKSTLERVLAEKNIISTILKNRNHIKDHTTEIKTLYKNFVEKYGTPEFVSKLWLTEQMQGKLNLESNHFNDYIIRLANFQDKLERLQTNMNEITINLHFMPEVQQANNIEAQINTRLEKRLTQNWRSKLATIASGSAIASWLAILISLTGLTGLAIAPSVLLGATLAFFQKKWLHKKEIAKLQWKLNDMSKEEREKEVKKILEQQWKNSKIVTDSQLNKNLEHDLSDLKTQLHELVTDTELNKEKALKLKELLSLATTLKFCQHEYWITQLAWDNETEYNEFIKNIHFWIQKFRDFAMTSSNSVKTKLWINPDAEPETINARYFLDINNATTRAIHTKGEEIQRAIRRKSNRRWAKDAIFTWALSGTLSFIMSWVTYWFGSKTIGSGQHIPVSRGEHIVKNLRTPLDRLKPLWQTLKNLIHSQITIPTIHGAVTFPTIPINSDKLSKKSIQNTFDEIVTTKDKIANLFNKKPKPKTKNIENNPEKNPQPEPETENSEENEENPNS